MNDRTLRTKNIRIKLNKELPELKKKSRSIDVATLAKKYNTTRATIGRILSERSFEVGDIHRTRITQNYCPAVWEFI